MNNILTRGQKARANAVPKGWPPPNLLTASGEFVNKVVFDLHGPILDWTKGFCRFAEERYNIKLKPETMKHYYMGLDTEFPLSAAQFDALFPVFARLARGGYGGLELRPGIQDTFRRIREAGIGIEIWTWCPGANEHNPETLKSYGTGIAQSATVELLQSVGLITDPLREVRFIKPDAKSHAMVEGHYPLIVEDNPVTAVAAGMACGLGALLVKESYNEDLRGNGIVTVKHTEIAPFVIDYFQKLKDAGALLGV